MISKTSTYEHIFAEVKRLSLAGLEGPDLLRRAAEKIKPVVPFEAYSAFTTDPATSLITHGIVEGVPNLEEAGKVYYDHVYFEEDVHRDASMFRQRRPVELLSERTAGKLERSLLYRELLRPPRFGHFGHKLFSILTDGGPWGRLTLMREAGAPDFGDKEVALVRRISPYLGAGLKAATLRSRAVVEQQTDDAPGVLILDRSGRVLSSTPSAERWLRDIEDLPPGWRENRGLPIAVRMVSAALHRALSPVSNLDSNLVPRLRLRARSGRWLALYGSVTYPTEGRPSETVVVVEPAKPEEVAWLNVTAHGLSPREEEVIKLVVRGFSNRQVSRALYISENTVQRHLSNIFEKVGVRSRKELLKRLFFENLLPSIVAN